MIRVGGGVGCMWQKEEYGTRWQVTFLGDYPSLGAGIWDYLYGTRTSCFVWFKGEVDCRSPLECFFPTLFLQLKQMHVVTT